MEEVELVEEEEVEVDLVEEEEVEVEEEKGVDEPTKPG